MKTERSVFDIFLDCAFSQDYNAMERSTEIEGKETQVRTQQSAALFHRWKGEKIIGESDRAFHFDFDFAFTVTDAATTATRRRRIGSSVFNNYYSSYVTPYAPPESRAHSKELTNYVVSSPRHASPWMTDRPICVIDQCSEWCATQNN